MIASIVYFLTMLSATIGTPNTEEQIKAGRISFFNRIFQDVMSGSELLRAFYKPKTREYCCMLCAIEPLCMSYSYCEQISCFLHSEDSFTAVNFTLKKNSKCVYVEMEREEHPSCVSNGDIVKITTDIGTEAQLCSINHKRVDGVWTEWNTTDVIFDNSTHYKAIDRRECLYISHGGIDCLGPSERENEIIFPTNQLFQYFTKANDFCATNYPGLFI